MTDKIDITAMTADTVAADLLGALVQELKLLPDIWVKLPQAEQDEIIDRLRKRVGDDVRQAVAFIASQQRVSVMGDLKRVNFADKVEAVFTLGARDPATLELANARGKACLIVVVDASEHMVGLDAVHGEPDQPDLTGLDAASSVVEQARRRSKGKGPDQPE